jgi:hypothetical protein
MTQIVLLLKVDALFNLAQEPDPDKNLLNQQHSKNILKFYLHTHTLTVYEIKTNRKGKAMQ